MGVDKEYETLLAKYNVLVAKTNDLQEQLNTKEKQWKEQDAKHKITNDLVRTLCENILAKDRKEMVLGTDYSWSGVGINELIRKAIKSFKEYNAERTDLLSKLMDVAETRRAQIESLEDQISRFIAGSSKPEDISSAQEIIEKAEKEAAVAEGKEKAPNRIKSAAEAGKVELIIEESDEVEVDGEMQLVEDMIEMNEQAKITSRSVPVSESRKRKQHIEQIKNEKSMAHMVDLVDFDKRMDNTMWAIAEVIGAQGVSKYPEIESKVLESNSELRKTRVRIAMQELVKMGAVFQDALSLPLTPKMFVYRLTDIGARLYKKHFEKGAVVSEVEKIIAEHDNAEHGYGILDVESVLKASGKYKEISSFNRKKAIAVKNHEKYIPDLICDTGKHKDYIEYERGLHTQSDFNAKCNKMVQVTRFLHFVAPNKGVLLKRILPQINAWVKSRGRDSLKNVKIKATTALALRDLDFTGDDCWIIIYDLNKSEAPIKCPG